MPLEPAQWRKEEVHSRMTVCKSAERRLGSPLWPEGSKQSVWLFS